MVVFEQEISFCSDHKFGRFTFELINN
jgi:hypothetical protein